MPKTTSGNSVDKIERKRRRRQAWFDSPVPAALVAEFTESEHAIIAVAAKTIGRTGGACVLHPASILKRAGVASDGAYSAAMGKACSFGLLARERRGREFLTRIVWLEKPEDIRHSLARAWAEEIERMRAAKRLTLTQGRPLATS